MLPNIAAILVVQATIQFALAILAEAALSYLGLGSRRHRRGGACSTRRRRGVLSAQQVYPGVAIALTVLGLNLMGDGLRGLRSRAWRGLE